MTKDIMTLEEFDDLAFAHGGDLAAWPDDLRVSAEAFAAAEPEALARLAQLDELNHDLAMARPVDPEPSTDLIGRILADAAEAAPRVTPPAEAPVPAHSPAAFDRFVSWLTSVGSPAAACAASAALGVWLGYAGPVDIASAATTYLDAEEAMELAFLGDLGSTPFIDALGALEGSE